MTSVFFIQLDGDENAMVWYDEIQETINLANSHAQEGVARDLHLP